MTDPINRYQRIALSVYADGDHNDIKTYRYGDRHGDALLTFVLAELADNEDCESLDMAAGRIQSGIEDLQTVLAALQAASPEAPDGVLQTVLPGSADWLHATRDRDT